MDKTSWTKSGVEAWDEEQDVVIEVLWHLSLSNMLKRPSIHLDSDDIRKARQSMFAEHIDNWMKKLGRVACYMGIAGVSFIGRNAIGPSWGVPTLLVCGVAGISLMVILEFLLNKK